MPYRRNDKCVRKLWIWLKTSRNETKERINQLEIAFVTVFKDFGHHVQQEISKCKGKDNPDVTKFRNKIKQLKSENDNIAL